MILSSETLNIIMGVCAAIVALIAFEIPQQSILGFLRKGIFKTSITILAFAVGIWATIKKDQLSSQEQQNAIERSDSIYQKKIDENLKWYAEKINSSNNENLRTYTAELAKYGLHYDSLQNKIAKLVIDSTGKKEIPYLEVCLGKIEKLDTSKKDKLLFDFRICNSQSVPAYNLIVNIRCLAKSKGEYILFNEKINNFFPSKPTIRSNTWISKQLVISGVSPSICDTLILVINGEYSNYYKSINKKLNEVDILLLRENIFGMFDPDEKLKKVLIRDNLIE